MDGEHPFDTGTTIASESARFACAHEACCMNGRADTVLY